MRGESRSTWAMMVPLLGKCILIILGLSISKYTADYKLLGSEAKEIIWNWNKRRKQELSLYRY